MTEPKTSIREKLRALYEKPHGAVGHLLATALHGLAFAACVVTWETGLWPLTAGLWLAVAWMNHATLARLHEAAHRMLFQSRIANEAVGIGIGTISLIPLTVYRHVHAQHHIHLGGEKDPEFWPYNAPQAPRWLRLLYAWLELGMGWLVTPALYSIRTFRAWPSLPRKQRRRLLGEFFLFFAFWTLLLGAIHFTQTWIWFLIAFIIPAWLTGTLQTVRKFTEHLGRFGDNVLDMTRTVVYTSPLGRAASESQLHVEHHGTHHQFPGIPFQNLPEASEIVFEEQKDGRVFPSHLAAIRDMLPHLADPKVGPQWNEGSSLAAEANGASLSR